MIQYGLKGMCITYAAFQVFTAYNYMINTKSIDECWAVQCLTFMDNLIAPSVVVAGTLAILENKL